VAMCVGGFVVFCLLLIWCKNRYREKQRIREYQERSAKVRAPQKYSINGSVNTTTSSPLKPPTVYNKDNDNNHNKTQSLLQDIDDHQDF